MILRVELEEVTTLTVWIFWITKNLVHEICKNLDCKTEDLASLLFSFESCAYHFFSR